MQKKISKAWRNAVVYVFYHGKGNMPWNYTFAIFLQERHLLREAFVKA
jgi:hypothetical protein